MFNEQGRHRRLVGDEEARLLAAASPHLRNLMVTALETGCRLGELLSLQWSQVRRLQNELFLPAAPRPRGRLGQRREHHGGPLADDEEES